MPNPLSRVRASAGFLIEPDAMTKRPDLAILVSQVIGVSAEAELMWALVAAAICHAVPNIFVAIYNDLTSAHAARAIFSAIAKSELDADGLRLFQTAEKVTAPFRKRRNEFAHSLWGISEQVSDALLLIEPNAWATFSAGFIGATAYRDGPPANIDTSRVMVYRKADLDIAVADAVEYRAIMLELRVALDRSWPVPDGASAMRKRLWDRPSFAKAYKSYSPEPSFQGQPSKNSIRHRAF